MPTFQFEAMDATGQEIRDVIDAATEEETQAFRKKFTDGGVGYGDLKKELAEKIIGFIKPMREKREKITDEEVYEVMKAGAQKALKVANEKMQEVWTKTGVIRNI